MEIIERHRQLIPRWHTSKKLTQLHLPKQSPNSDPITEEEVHAYRLREANDRWESKRNISNAIELLSKIKLIGKNHPSKNELEAFLLHHRTELSESTKDLVAPYLKQIDDAMIYSTSEKKVYSIINNLKRLVRTHPNDSLLWNDLAFYYAIIREHKKSHKCMTIAFTTSRKHAFIARAYARLLINQDRPDDAIEVLKSTNLSNTNPLIASAELAIRSQFQIGKVNLKRAERILEAGQINERFKSELFAAVGTIEIESGATNQAKRNLRSSLLLPTENTVAQIKWLENRFKTIIDQKSDILVPSLEGQVIELYANSEYRKCRDTLLQLHAFEPFSDRAIVDAGYITMVALNEPTEAIEIYNLHPIITARSFMATNNKVVALLEIGENDQIDTLLYHQRSLIKNDRERMVYTATLAMYLYKLGLYDEGRKHYHHALTYFEQHQESSDLGRLLYYFGKEEIKVNEKMGKELLQKAKAIFLKSGSTNEYIGRITGILEQKQSTFSEMLNPITNTWISGKDIFKLK